MVELTDIEKLALAQAFVNVVGDMTKTKCPGNLRGRVDDYMKERYYDDPMAPKSCDVKVFGKKVGTYSITVSKPTASKVKRSLEVSDPDALMAWAAQNGMLKVDMDAVMANFELAGEVPDGCNPIEVMVPGDEGGVVTKTTLKVDSNEVAKAFGAYLEPAAWKMLEGGFDD